MQRFTDKDFTQPERTVPIAIGMRHMAFQLNGRTFDMQDYMEIEKIPLNSVQRIRISHTSDMMRGGSMRGGHGGMGMMMSMSHPIHLHGQQFQILSRRQNHPDAAYDTVKGGFVDTDGKIRFWLCQARKLKSPSHSRITRVYFCIIATI